MGFRVAGTGRRPPETASDGPAIPRAIARTTVHSFVCSPGCPGSPSRSSISSTRARSTRKRWRWTAPPSARTNSSSRPARPTSCAADRRRPPRRAHTHYAFSIPDDEYDDWWDRLSGRGYDLEEAQFGPAKSLYLYDPDGNCVELGQQGGEGPGIDGVFEVVLEVEDLDRAEAFYTQLGFETADVGDDRKRIRMNGPMALELWEPHLGIADARGGVHVDLGFETSEPTAALEAVSDDVRQVDHVSDERVVVRDPDGHVVTFAHR